MIARGGGGLLLALGAAVAVLPALAWYSAGPPTTPARASGFAGSGQAWLLPVLGVAIALCGAALVASGPGRARRVARRVGVLVLVAGLAAFSLALWAVLDPALILRVRVGGTTEAVAAPASLEPAAIVTLAVCALAAAAGAGLTWAGRRA